MKSSRGLPSASPPVKKQGLRVELERRAVLPLPDSSCRDRDTDPMNWWNIVDYNAITEPLAGKLFI